MDRPAIPSAPGDDVVGGGPGGRNAPPPRVAPQEASEIEWPETLPAFSGNDAVQMTPDGQVWVQRVKSASDKTPTYDIFDGTRES